MIKNYRDLTIIIITFKSDEIIYKFIKKIPKKIKVIVVENSINIFLKKRLEKKFNNTKVYLRRNEGVAGSLNFGVKKSKTKYVLHLSPDLDLNYNDIKYFFEYAKILKDDFCALGPRFLKTKKKGHIQIDKSLKIGQIDSIHGSYMFFNKKKFNIIGAFDKKIFLFFEETEYCYRAKKKGYLSYQINKSKVKSLGRSVDIEEEKNENFSNILIWHFIWSKYYFTKKKYGQLISIVIFTPILIRIILRITLYKITGNYLLLEKYRARFDGLLKSIKNEKSSLRP